MKTCNEKKWKERGEEHGKRFRFWNGVVRESNQVLRFNIQLGY